MFSKIQEKISSHIGIYAENLKTGKIYEVNSSNIFSSASVIKLFILYTLYLEFLSENASPTQELFFEKKLFADDSIFFQDKQDGFYKLKDIAYSMITISDNTSTNLLIDFLSFEKINNTIKTLDMKNTILKRKMCDFKSFENGIDNITTPKDIAIFFKALIKNIGHLIKPSELNIEYFKNYKTLSNISLEIIKILTEQKDTEKIFNGINDKNILIASKPGELPNIRNDTALIIDSNTNCIINIFCEGVFDEKKSDNQIGNLAKLLFEYLMDSQ